MFNRCFPKPFLHLNAAVKPNVQSPICTIYHKKAGIISIGGDLNEITCLQQTAKIAQNS